MKLTGFKEIFKASEMHGPAKIEGNAKIGVLKYAVKILEKYLDEVNFEDCNFTENEVPHGYFLRILTANLTC